MGTSKNPVGVWFQIQSETFVVRGKSHIKLSLSPKFLTWCAKFKKEQRAKAKKFLKEVGVKEIGEEEEIKILLNSRYKNPTEPVDLSTNTKDIKAFMEYLEKNSSFINTLSEYNIFICSNGKMKAAKNIFIDTPFKKTGVASYFDELVNPKTYALSDKYKKVIDSADIVSLATRLGAKSNVPILKTTCRINPKSKLLYYAGHGRRTGYEQDRDYAIAQLVRLMKSPNLDLSKTIWKSISNVDEKWWEARYRRNYSDPYKTNLSQLGYVLKAAKWIPQEGGLLVIPAEASVEKLPGGFKFDKEWPWLQAMTAQ